MRSHLQLVQNLMTGSNIKVKDQELKSGANALKKSGAGTSKAKKAGLKGDEQTAILIPKVKALGDLLEHLKAFRSAIMAAKASMTPKQIVEHLSDISKAWQDLSKCPGKDEVKVKHVAFPSFWVQSWLSQNLSFKLPALH